MKVQVECMFLSSNWSGYHSLKVEIWVQIPVGIQYGALDELVKSLHFQCRDYGFESHRHYYNGAWVCLVKMPHCQCGDDGFKSHMSRHGYLKVE